MCTREAVTVEDRFLCPLAVAVFRLEQYVSLSSRSVRVKELSDTAVLCDDLTHKVLINYQQRNYRRFPMSDSSNGFFNRPSSV